MAFEAGSPAQPPALGQTRERVDLRVRGRSRGARLRSAALPYLLVLPTIALLALFMYVPDYGAINQVLTSLHLANLTQAWLGDPKLAIYSIMFIGFPFVDGFGLLIYTAGLQAISAELLQAAAVDGAGPWSRFWRIELPLVVGQIRLLMVLNMIWAIQ